MCTAFFFSFYYRRGNLAACASSYFPYNEGMKRPGAVQVQKYLKISKCANISYYSECLSEKRPKYNLLTENLPLHCILSIDNLFMVVPLKNSCNMFDIIVSCVFCDKLR